MSFTRKPVAVIVLTLTLAMRALAQTETPHVDIDTLGQVERLTFIVFSNKEAGIFVKVKEDKSNLYYNFDYAGLRIGFPLPKEKDDPKREPWDYAPALL